MQTRPKLIVFDLDATAWINEMYLLSGPPFKKTNKRHLVVDRAGEPVELAPGTLHALNELLTNPEWAETKIGVASRTNYIEWAETCLKMLCIHANGDEQSLKDVISFSEIYPTNKTKHFAALKKASGLEYHEMVFFDNEMRNVRDVQKLGVHAFYTPDAMTVKAWNQMLKKFE